MICFSLLFLFIILFDLSLLALA